MRGLTLWCLRGWPVSKRPRLFISIEGAKATDLRQVLAQAVPKAQQAGIRRTVKQAVTQLQQHHSAQEDFRQLPNDGENHHPKDAQQNRFALQFLIAITHAHLLAGSSKVNLKNRWWG